jgi:hypothetical protein
MYFGKEGFVNSGKIILKVVTPNKIINNIFNENQLSEAIFSYNSSPVFSEKQVYNRLGENNIPDGCTVQVDHQINTFVVSIRSNQPISADGLKDLIQNKFEVIDCIQTDGSVVVQHP